MGSKNILLRWTDPGDLGRGRVRGLQRQRQQRAGGQGGQHQPPPALGRVDISRYLHSV